MKDIHKLKKISKKNPKLKGFLDHEEYGQIHYIKEEKKENKKYSLEV